jgi:hypothetical protein
MTRTLEQRDSVSLWSRVRGELRKAAIDVHLQRYEHGKQPSSSLPTRHPRSFSPLVTELFRAAILKSGSTEGPRRICKRYL